MCIFDVVAPPLGRMSNTPPDLRRTPAQHCCRPSPVSPSGDVSGQHLPGLSPFLPEPCASLSGPTRACRSLPATYLPKTTSIRRARLCFPTARSVETPVSQTRSQRTHMHKRPADVEGRAAPALKRRTPWGCFLGLLLLFASRFLCNILLRCVVEV